MLKLYIDVKGAGGGAGGQKYIVNDKNSLGPGANARTVPYIHIYIICCCLDILL